MRDEEAKKRYAGEIRLSFINRQGSTVADRTFRHGNSRISANIPVVGGVPYYFLISTGGGYTEGESYRQQVFLGDGTHAILTTQTPNYVYKCEHGRLTSQENKLEIGDHCLLEYYMDETIPYAKAHFYQYTDVDLGEDSAIILTDGLTAGWSGDEKPFQYGQVGIRTRISRRGRLLFHDYLLVDPSEDPMDKFGYFEGNADFNTAVIIDRDMDGKILREMRDAMQEFPTSCRYGMSLLEEEGAVLRVLGDSAWENRKVIWRWISYYREKVRELPPVDLRKGTAP